MTEYAIIEHGEIVNVVTTSGGRDAAQRVAAGMEGTDLTVVPLDSLPLDVKRRYRYWDERP